MTVEWTAPAAELTITGYDLQWRSDADAEWTNVTGLGSTATSYKITGLHPQTIYEVQVRALFATTAGAWSKSIFVETEPQEKPPAADGPGISARETGSNSITVTWTAPATDETITGYELEWRSNTDEDWTVVTGISGTETSYEIAGLQPQTTYEVRVRALFATTDGAWSESISASTTISTTISTTTPPARPPASDRPTLSLEAVSDSSITVSWVAPAIDRSITSYELEVSGGHFSVSTTFTGIPSTQTAARIYDVHPQATYQIRVRAMFGGVAGSWSAPLTCTTDVPSGPALVGFFCQTCTATLSEDFAAATTGGLFVHSAAAFYVTAETFPTTIKYEVSETGDMLESAAKGTFETPPRSFDGARYTFYVAYPLIRLPIIDDDVDEPDSTITVQILPDPRYQFDTQSSFTVTITDDDDPPSVEVDDVAATEGDSGTVNATFTVSLNAASGWTVTVDWATSDGTATAGADYTAGSGTLTFAAGDTSKTFDVAVTGDTEDEADETFTVTLSNAEHASIPDATGTGTITDDD